MKRMWLWLGRAIGLVALLVVGACASWRPAPTAPALPAPATTVVVDDWIEARQRMVEEQIAARGITDTLALDAMRRIPRHEFVPGDERDQAYADHPLPIGYGQTISQPYIVALMTQLLGLRRGDKVLEIGTGSGYQAAVLAALTDEVYTVEIIPELAANASTLLARLGYSNIRTRNADGYYGWEEEAPFDAIIVTAAPDHVPPPLVRQLREGGRLVIPVGSPGSYQTLWRLTKRGDEVVSENITGVIFVPLTRGR